MPARWLRRSPLCARAQLGPFCTNGVRGVGLLVGRVGGRDRIKGLSHKRTELPDQNLFAAGCAGR